MSFGFGAEFKSGFFGVRRFVSFGSGVEGAPDINVVLVNVDVESFDRVFGIENHIAVLIEPDFFGVIEGQFLGGFPSVPAFKFGNVGGCLSHNFSKAVVSGFGLPAFEQPVDFQSAVFNDDINVVVFNGAVFVVEVGINAVVLASFFVFSGGFGFGLRFGVDTKLCGVFNGGFFTGFDVRGCEFVFSVDINVVVVIVLTDFDEFASDVLEDTELAGAFGSGTGQHLSGAGFNGDGVGLVSEEVHNEVGFADFEFGIGFADFFAERLDCGFENVADSAFGFFGFNFGVGFDFDDFFRRSLFGFFFGLSFGIGFGFELVDCKSELFLHIVSEVVIGGAAVVVPAAHFDVVESAAVAAKFLVPAELFNFAVAVDAVGFFCELVTLFGGAVRADKVALILKSGFLRDCLAGLCVVVSYAAVLRDFRGVGCHFVFLLKVSLG